MLLSELKDEIENELRSLEGSLAKINNNFNGLVKSVESGMDASKKINKLTENILSNSKAMLRKTPEAKGILIYLLTRHAFSDHIDLDNRGEDVPLDIYHYRKKAILVILASIQTQRE